MDKLSRQLAAVEAKLDIAEKRRKFHEERAPSGTRLCGAAYGWDGRTIVKAYDGFMRAHINPCIVAVHVCTLIDDICFRYEDALKENALRAKIMHAVPVVIGVDLEHAVLFMEGYMAKSMAGLIDAARQVDALFYPDNPRANIDIEELQEVRIEMVKIRIWDVLVNKQTGRRRSDDNVLLAASADGGCKTIRDAADRMLAETPEGGYKCISKQLLRSLKIM